MSLASEMLGLPRVGELAARLDLTLVEGLATGELPVTPAPNHVIRMVGTRGRRGVEVVYLTRTREIPGGWLGPAECEVSRDWRMTMQVASSVQLEIVGRALVDAGIEPRVMQPPVRLGSPIDDRLRIRASHREAVRRIEAELALLAAMPGAHVTLLDGRLTLHDHPGYWMIGLCAERVLPIFERIADELERAPAFEEPEAQAAPGEAPEETGLGARVDVMHPSRLGALLAGVATLCLALIAPYLALAGAIGRAPGELAGALVVAGLAVAAALATASAVRSKIVLRQHGFEWHRLRGVLALRYSEVTDAELEIDLVERQQLETLRFDAAGQTFAITGYEGLLQLRDAMRSAR